MNTRLLYILILLLSFFNPSVAQNTDRAYKNIEKGELDKALEILLKAHEADSLNVSADVGLAVVYSISTFPQVNYFKAWQYVNDADRNFDRLTDKEKESMNEFLFNIETLKTNWPVKQKFELIRKDVENKLIKYVREEKDLDMVNEFIRRFPDSKFYENVLHIRNYLEFGKAANENTIEAYDRFIHNFPDAAQIPEAIENRNQLAFSIAMKANTVSALKEFINKYPSASQVVEAILRLNELAFDAAKNKNTVEALEAFIHDYPDAIQVPAAMKLQQRLVYEKAKQINTFEAFSEFIKKYPEGEQFVDVFNLRSAALGDRYIKMNPGLNSRIIWTRAFDHNALTDRAGDIVATPDGNVVVSGSSSAGPSGIQEGWVMETDPDGKLVWSKSFPANKGNYPASIDNASSGDFFAAGYTVINPDSGLVRGWFLRINPQGFKYWDKDKDINATGVVRLCMNGDKEFNTAGYTTDSAGAPHYWLSLWKENGKNIWTRNYTGKGILNGLSTGTMNEVYAAGGRWCFKSDHNGYLVWEYFSEPTDSIIGMTVNPAGEVLLAVNAANNQQKIIRLNKLGKKISSINLSTTSDFVVNAMKPGKQGELWLCGNIGTDAVVVKVGSSNTSAEFLHFHAEASSSVKNLAYAKDGSIVFLISTGSPVTNDDILLVTMKP